MSQENVEVVKRAIDALNRRDTEARRTFLAPDVELDWSESRGPASGIYRGYERLSASGRITSTSSRR
jgi:ketosteroid isomerase-like protein